MRAPCFLPHGSRDHGPLRCVSRPPVSDRQPEGQNRAGEDGGRPSVSLLRQRRSLHDTACFSGLLQARPLPPTTPKRTRRHSSPPSAPSCGCARTGSHPHVLGGRNLLLCFRDRPQCIHWPAGNCEGPAVHASTPTPGPLIICSKGNQGTLFRGSPGDEIHNMLVSYHFPL